MHRNKNFKLYLLLLLLALLVSGCGGGTGGPNDDSSKNEQIKDYLPQSSARANSDNDYQFQVLILTSSESLNSEGIYQHFQQGLVPNVNLSVKTVGEELKLDHNYDLVYLDTKLSIDNSVGKVEDQLVDYVQSGGILFLSHEYLNAFPKDFLGIEGIEKVDTVEMNFSYPEVRKNLSGLQKVWQSFADDYRHYQGLNPNYHINYEQAAIADTATVLVEQDGLAYLLANSVGEGTVIWANNFMPNEQFITRFDFISEDSQKYFHFGYASANYLFRNELISFVSKEKYGFALKKGYGPYGRPGIAWQNHYEALYSFVLRDMINWTKLLTEYNQIPTFSVIRGSYNWGQWHSSISLQVNQGTDSEPIFPGETDNSFYSSGVRLETESDYLTFGRYPGFKTLLSEITLPHRSYPQVVDWNGNGKKDLIVGAWDGKLYLVENIGTDAAPRFREVVNIYTANRRQMSVGSYSAPLVYDFNDNGLFDLLVGNGDGKIQIFLNTGTATRPSLTEAGFVEAGGRTLKVNSDATPIIADWNNNGIPDLLVGESTGRVIFFEGRKTGGALSFASGVPLKSSDGLVEVDKFAAPFAVDYNNNGRLDLLVGGGDGEIALYVRSEEEQFVNQGKVEGQNYNFFGTRAINIGNNAVPFMVDWNNNGKKDLLIGQLEYGIPYPIDSEFFPYKSELNENIQYALDRKIPLIPHMHLHEFKTEEGEIREIQLHKEAFQEIGIPWDDDIGVNHHTWRIHRNDPTRTFRNLMDAGVWWNFGFNPPNVGSAPRDGREFLWVIPFVLPDGDNIEPFVMFVSAPHALNFSKTWDSLAEFDLPLTYFEHIEHSLQPNTPVYEKLINKINFMNEFKGRHEYNFMTEEQMARSLLNTFYAEVRVKIDEGELTITPDYTNVPSKVKEYAETLGIKVELGEALAGSEVDSSGMFYYHGPTGYYLGLNETIKVSFLESTDRSEQIYIVRSNGPVDIDVTDDNKIILNLNTTAMQEVKLHSPIPLRISGANLKVENDGNYYTVTHYGDKVEVTVEF